MYQSGGGIEKYLESQFELGLGLPTLVQTPLVQRCCEFIADLQWTCTVRLYDRSADQHFNNYGY